MVFERAAGSPDVTFVCTEESQSGPGSPEMRQEVDGNDAIFISNTGKRDTLFKFPEPL